MKKRAMYGLAYFCYGLGGVVAPADKTGPAIVAGIGVLMLVYAFARGDK